MTIPAGTTSYFGRFDDPEKFRLIPQAGIRIRPDAGGTGYPSCWDMNVSPYDGTLYFSPCDETGRGAHTRLVAYDWDKDEAHIAMKIERLTLPRKRHMPHSKLHESISFLPDGRVVGSTHSTDRAPHQSEWMPFAHVDHIWDGFPGSYVLMYDPKTDKSYNLGMPAPRESIYGMTYDKKYNALYMIGFMKGHVYRLSLDDKTVKDLGKAAEVFCYRLHRGPDDHIYAMTKSGYLFRINVDTQELEDLNWRLPAYPHNYVNNTWYRYMAKAQNIDDHRFVFTNSCGDNMFVFDCRDLSVTDLGSRTPFNFESDFFVANFSLNEFGLDKEGVLWYGLVGSRYTPPTDEFVKPTVQMLLMRWDFQRGEKPQCLGIIGTQEWGLTRCTCLTLDKTRDRLYMIGILSPVGENKEEQKFGLFMIDLAEMRPRVNERGPIWVRDMTPTPMTEEEIADAKAKAAKPIVWVGEEVSAKNPVTALPIDRVTPIRLWRQVPHTAISDSKVQGLAWDAEGNLHGICGDQNKYYFKIASHPYESFASRAELERSQQVWVYKSIMKGAYEEKEENGRILVKTPNAFSWPVTEFVPYEQISVGLAQWLSANMLPGKLDVDPALKMPEIAGRRYLAKATAQVSISDNRTLIGTRDGLLAVAKFSSIFNLGNCAPHGPVRCLCTNADGTKVWGTAGDDEDMGTVFTYDDQEGLRQLGVISYNSHGWMDGPTAAHILSSVVVSPDERTLAVGGADRLGSVHLFRL